MNAVVSLDRFRVDDFLSAKPSIVPFRKQDILDSIIGGFHSFIRAYCDLDPGIRQELWRTGEDEESSTGCIEKDDKIIFQYRPGTIAQLVKKGVDLKAHKEWIQNLRLLYDRCSDLALAFGRSLAATIDDPRVNDGLEWSVKENENLLKVIHYPEGSEHLILRDGHYDNTAFTLHAGDNRPGLLVMPEDGSDWISVKASSDEAIIFPGTQITTLTNGIVSASTGRRANKIIRPMKHRVDRYREAVGFDQWAIVYLVRVLPGHTFLED
jgi:hypothetical protein